MNRSRIATGIFAFMFATVGSAADFEYGVEAGIGTSDNISRAPSNEQSETIATAGLDLRLARSGSRAEADINVDLSYFDYQDDTYDSELTGRADADIRFKLAPGRFEWVLVDNFGQAQLDPFAVSTPDNRENINYFTTGPDVTFRFGSLASLTIFGRYSFTQYEESNFDDERLLGGISLGRELSARSNLSLNAMTERVEFDDSAFGSDYDRQSAFLRYVVNGARTQITAEGGYTEIHDLGSTSSSPLLTLDISRDLSERSTLTLTGGIRSSDSASALRAGAIPGGETPTRPEEVSASDPFETRDVTIGWRFDAQRTNFMLTAGHEKDEYETQSLLDRERTYFRASVQRQIKPRLTLRAAGSLYSTEYDATNDDDDETELGLYLSWNAVGRLFVEVDVESFSRDSSNPLTEFDETRAFLRFAWRNTGGAGSR